MQIEYTEEVWKEGNMYVAYSPELDIAGCGDTIELAKKNLAEVIQINIEETERKGKLNEFLDDAGLVLNDDIWRVEKELVGFAVTKVAV